MRDAHTNIIPAEERLIDRVYWLINLRWIAIAGVVSTVYIASEILHIPLEVFPLYGVVFFLIVNAVLLRWVIVYFQDRKFFKKMKTLMSFQLFLDLFYLAALIHFSGGIENPFYFYFIFHIIIAGILLSRRATYLIATYASAIFLIVVFCEQCGFLTHHCLKGVFSAPLSGNFLYLMGASFVFMSTLYITAYLTTSISIQLTEREQSLKVANKLLKEKDRVKSEYVLRVTHDIKEDLAAIHSCIEPVQKGITGALNERQTDLLRRARVRSKQLVVFVDALLEITRLKLTEKIEMKYFSVNELVQEIQEMFAVSAQEKQISFEVCADPDIPSMKGVRVYVHEAILNLLNNSLKYTPEKGKIVWEIRNHQNVLFVKISDTGIGIPREDLPRIFEEFYRAGNAKEREKKGTGLGLSITKAIAEMHHGKVWVESELGKGTSVYLEFPSGA
ncbi:MAG: hypothetical protein A3G33_05875 [Omnitrophica bacterium RIFCSPLOWO2_12_FULL_44_17]|uniref:histidine kinase n=1 Tax=Candidatus Danuiimicrobium aquiferis TaxID=1801832 RepID=A0A1G1L2G8_9BACT|nr:MAG: hypothetical protein A3B72_06105 [Omnitrophica bacterium RIFCSPHIGHO2_02_FULL_45_28]OGW99318.1 MAG: hypothetical protein A3G33_05875 [Omnitrophica bacterium RIFCSPLOWO2_12_FULL_44_17]OGX02481.1 MAG: hypothetical protein A3J12_09335 [Omnitrophica bacterium RIFCSPLOWO2_02_FULL_44_11]